MGFDKNATSVVDYELWALAHREKEPSKTSRFVTLSAVFHAAALVTVALMATPLVDELKSETITIELEDIAPPMQISKGSPVEPTKGSSAAPVVQEPLLKEEVVTAQDITLPKELPAKALPAKETPAAKPAAPIEKVVAAPPAKPAPAKAVAPAKTAAVAKTNFQAVPATIDDIDAPELDAGEYAKTPVAANIGEDFSDEFSKVDHAQATALKNEKKAMDDMAAALASEQNEALNNIESANDEETQRWQEAQENLRSKNAAALASALASEKAEAQAAAAARAAAEREAAEKEGGRNAGMGVGNNGEDTAGTAVAGAPTGVRSLDQLRQMPGNPRPQYSREERLRGDQGEIAFIAYISKEGYPVQFQMRKSTGFRNLDSKTLAALKKWRFYPGQEGWVELPFRWDLKGGVQEDGGLLRRVGSRTE